MGAMFKFTNRGGAGVHGSIKTISWASLVWMAKYTISFLYRMFLLRDQRQNISSPFHQNKTGKGQVFPSSEIKSHILFVRSTWTIPEEIPPQQVTFVSWLDHPTGKNTPASLWHSLIFFFRFLLTFWHWTMLQACLVKFLFISLKISHFSKEPMFLLLERGT